AVNAVASGFRSDVIDRIAGAACHPFDDVLDARGPEAEHVHERISGVTIVEDHLATDGGNADAVAVSGDAGHHAFEVSPHPWILQRPEAQGIHQRNGPRAHREDVADDAADARGCTLVRLDE